MKNAIISREAGFTLVELMMVIFVVGIMAGLVVMTVGSNTARELKKDATRMQQLLVMAQDEAEFSGREIGFFIDDRQKTYGFLFFDEQALAWNILEKDSFNQRELPESIQLSLDVDGAPVDIRKIYKDAQGKSESLDNWLTTDDKKTAKRNKNTPTLIFFSDGHYTPFRLQVGNKQLKDTVFSIVGDGFGAVRISDSADKGKKPSKKKSSVQ